MPTSASVAAAVPTWGIDLAAPTALLAQRGFEGLVCNDVADLGQWRLGEGAALLHLADGALSALRRRERVADESVVVGVAVPGWVGSLERHDLADLLVAGEASVSVTCVSSTTCLAVGSNRAAVYGGAMPADETVLAVDADLGWGAGVVRISAHAVVEVACAAVTPGSTVDRDGLLGSLLAATSTTTDRAPDRVPIDRVVVIGPPGEEALIAASLERLLDAQRPPIVVVATRRTTAAGALVLGSPAADRDAGGSLLSGRTASGGEPWRLVQSAVRVTGASFGAVAGPADIAVVVGDSMPPAGLGQHQGADVAAAMVAVASASVTVATAGLVSTAATGRLSDGAWPDDADETSPADDADDADDVRPPHHAAESRPESAGSPGDDGAGASAALAGALVRCERLLSYEVGAHLAVRSVPALVGCDDDAAVDELVSAAAGLREVAVHRGDELGGALLDAVDVGLACVLADPEHRYVAGTLADVRTEVERVVEHLRVVVGVVAPAERARIARDVALLGPGPASAAALVAEVVGPQPAGLDVPPDARVDEPGHRPAAAVWRSSDGRFVLADPVIGDPVSQGTTAIRVLIER